MKKKEGKYEENKLSNILYEKKMCFFAKHDPLNYL